MEYVALCGAAFLGGIVSGFAGFAFSAVAGAILLHFFEPSLAVPLMMVCSVGSQITSLAAINRLIDWREIAPLLLGGAAGVPIALYLLTVVDKQMFRIGFGVFLASYAVYMLVRPKLACLSRVSGSILRSAIGFAGGCVGGLTAMPGAVPAIWCDLRGMPKERQRGLVQPFILIMQVLALLLIFGTPGAVHPDLLMYSVYALPTLIVGTMIGVALFGRIDEVRFRYSVLSLLLISGCLMIR